MEVSIKVRDRVHSLSTQVPFRSRGNAYLENLSRSSPICFPFHRIEYFKQRATFYRKRTRRTAVDDFNFRRVTLLKSPYEGSIAVDISSFS